MKKNKLLYIENLRLFLIVLVVIQHVVRAYGLQVWWFIQDDYAPVLEHFTSVNSTFFMSLFFLLSFYFMPNSYDKKKFILFHKDRLLRLFVPLIIYVAVFVTTMMYFYYIKFRGYEPLPFTIYLKDYFLGLAQKPTDWTGPSWPDLNLGHLWFLQHLLIYGILYSLFRVITRNKLIISKNPVKFPSVLKIIIFAFVLSIITFLVRGIYPLYKWTGFLGFIQIEFAHFPFYFSMFFIGIYASGKSLFEILPQKTGKIWLAIGIVSSMVIAFMPIESAYYGDLSVQSLIYVIFETYACFGMITGLLYLFKKYFNNQNSIVYTLTQNTYMVYIIHLPVVVVMQYILLPFTISPYLKFTIITVSSIPIIFGISYLLRKIPYANKYI